MNVWSVKHELVQDAWAVDMIGIFIQLLDLDGLLLVTERKYFYEVFA